jgi:hypothetical protein
VDDDISDTESRHFKAKWERYKRSALQGATAQHVVDQLWACCSNTLEKTIFRQGVDN